MGIEKVISLKFTHVTLSVRIKFEHTIKTKDQTGKIYAKSNVILDMAVFKDAQDEKYILFESYR